VKIIYKDGKIFTNFGFDKCIDIDACAKKHAQKFGGI